MRIRLYKLLLLLAAVAGPACADDLVLTNVNVVDVDAGRIIAGRSVVVSDGYIREIGAQESVRVPAGARVIDEGGRYLMPALWDMHTHPMQPEALSMFVANGVGGVRIMWGLPRHLEWRARVELGELLGPRLLIAGPIVEGVPPQQMASVVDTEGRRLVKTFAEGVAEVRRQKAAGFDYIKVYNNIPLEAYKGLVAEADRLRMPSSDTSRSRSGSMVSSPLIRNPSSICAATSRSWCPRTRRFSPASTFGRERSRGSMWTCRECLSWCARRGLQAPGSARR